MDQFLERLLLLPPGATLWNELMHRFARAGHSDLPRVLRRISAAVPPTEETALGFLYWAASEEFVRHGFTQFLPEIAEGFAKLDLHSYDPDALTNVGIYLLSEGFETETLRLAEHFLPIDSQDELMSYSVPNRCWLIYDLRVGLALRSNVAPERTEKEIADDLRRGIEDEIDPESAQGAAAVLTGRDPAPAWTRAQFSLVPGDRATRDAATPDWPRLGGVLARVAQEARQLEQLPPGRALRSLSLMLASACIWREERARKKKKVGDNLLDFLRPAGLEQRVAKSCASMVGICRPQVRLALHAHEILARFAARHALISTAQAAEFARELARLQTLI